MPDLALTRLTPRWLPHLPSRTARLLLTLLYGGLFLLSGAMLLAITYFLFRSATGINLIVVPTGTSQGSTGPDSLKHLLANPEVARYVRQVAESRVGHVEQANATELHQLLVQSGIALAIMTVISIALGWLVAGRVLRPLRAMTAATREISEHNLHERLGLPGPRDELKDLAGAAARVAADARLERARPRAAGAVRPRRGRRGGTARPAAGDGVSRRADRQRDRARSRHGQRRPRGAARPQPDRQRREPQRPRRPRAGEGEGRGRGAFLSVANDGAVIPASEVERLFEPFQRLGTDRMTPSDGHHGLGLSIVRAIAAAHHATLLTEARPEGALPWRSSFRNRWAAGDLGRRGGQ